MHSRSVLLGVCLVALLALAVAAAPALDSNGAVRRRPTHHTHGPRRIKYAQPEYPGRHLQKGAGAKLDWHKSVFEGVDRADLVAGDAPTQIRLAFIPGGMAVSFSLASQAGSPLTVHYGLSSGSLSSSVSTTESSTYGTLFFYTALLQNLQPKTRYYYQIDGSSTVSSFVTAPTTGSDEPFTVLVVGDMGLENSANTMRQMTAALPDTDFFLHIGDLSYADDFYLRPNNTYEGSWNQWQDLMMPITSSAAYMTLPGNHEITCTEVTPFLCPQYQRNLTAYRNRFRMPWRETGGVENLWYSYDYGNVHFIQINTETDYPNSPMGPGTFYNAGPFGDQMAWLQADLMKAAANRAQVPWIVVSGHRPLYSSGHEEKQCQAAFETLFLKFNVDVYFAGHVHWYERLWPVGAGGAVTSKSYVQPAGFVSIINGAAGNVEGLNTAKGSLAPYTAMLDNSDFGYGTLHVANATAMHWQYFRSTDNSVLDDIWIYKTH